MMTPIQNTPTPSHLPFKDLTRIFCAQHPPAPLPCLQALSSLRALHMSLVEAAPYDQLPLPQQLTVALSAVTLAPSCHLQYSG